MLEQRFPYELSVWLTSSFPVGSFAFSHGLEWAAGDSRIVDRASAEAWIADLLDAGGPRNDAIILAATWHAMSDLDAEPDRLRAVNELAIALAGTKERILETTAQGNAFMTMMLAAWSRPDIASARRALPGDVAFPVAVGIASAAHGVALAAALRAYLASIVVNMTSALVRLAVVGQTDAQRIIANLMPRIDETATAAEPGRLDDIATATFVGDIAAIAHETQDTRLFRT